jgi:hypothetical protein
MKCPSCHKEIPDASLICIFCNAVFSEEGKIISGSKSATLRAGKIKYRIIITALTLAVIFIVAAAFTYYYKNKKATITSHRATCLENLKNMSLELSISMDENKSGGMLPAADANWISIVKNKTILTCPASGMAPGSITYGYNGNLGGKNIKSFTGDLEGIPLFSECNTANHLIMTDTDVVKTRHQDDNGVSGYCTLTLGGAAIYNNSNVTMNWDKLPLITPLADGNAIDPSNPVATGLPAPTMPNGTTSGVLSDTTTVPSVPTTTTGTSTAPTTTVVPATTTPPPPVDPKTAKPVTPIPPVKR